MVDLVPGLNEVMIFNQNELRKGWSQCAFTNAAKVPESKLVPAAAGSRTS